MTTSKNKDVKRGIVLYLDGKKVDNDIKSIKAECNRLTRELERMTVGSKEYNEQMKKIRQLNGIIAQHRQELRGTGEELSKNGSLISKANAALSKYGGLLASAVAGITGVTLAFRQFREERNKIESSQASLKALTGLDDTSIAWLTRQAKTLSTTMTKEGLRVRQSANEILDAFMLVGSAKPELLGNKEALAAVTEEAMRLQAAAGDIDLKQAVDSLTLALNQYGASADQAGKYANVLAAGSKAGAANIASQAAAIQKAGVAAAGANASIEQTVGLIETLAYKGIKDEIAGTGLKKFFLTLQTGAEETNPAIVGLDKALENLAAKQMTAAQMKKMFGEEGYNVAKVILDNLPMVKQYTEAVTGTSIAYEQAAINSDTAAARLAQAKNRMKVAMAELGDRLQEVYSVGTNLATYLVKVLPSLIDWFKEWGVTVVALAIPFAAYAAKVYAVAAAHKVWNAVLATGKGLMMAYKSTVWLLTAAKLALTGNIEKATKAMKLFNLTCNKNIYLAIASAILAIGVAVYQLCTRATEAQKQLRRMNEELLTEQTQLDSLFAALKRTNPQSKERAEIIKEINGKYGEYLPYLLEEKSTLDEIEGAYRRVNGRMVENIVQKHKEEAVNSLVGKAAEDQMDAVEAVRSSIEKKLGSSKLATLAVQELKQITTEFYNAGSSWDKAFNQAYHTIKTKYFGDKGMSGVASNEMSEYVKSYYNMQKEIQDINKRFDNWMPNRPENELEEVTITANAPKKETATAGGTSSGNEKERKKRVNAELQRIDTDFMHEQTHLQRLYLEGEITTEEEYNALLLDLEKQYLDQKLAISGLEPHKREELQVKMYEALKKFHDQCQTQEEKAQKEKEKLQKKASDERYKQLENEYKMEVQQATQKHYTDFTSEEEYQAELASLAQNFYNRVLNDAAVSAEKKQEIQVQNERQTTEQMKREYDKQVEAFNSKKNAILSASQQMGEAMSDFFTNEETDFKDFMANVLKILLDTFEKQLIAQQAAAIASITMKEVTTKGFAGIATAAAKIALITAAFEAAKAVLGQFYTGGYTPDGRWDEPKGIVHSNEFVANRYAVANPAVRPVLDLIDTAQRRGTVANLTADDIAAVSPSAKRAVQQPVVIQQPAARQPQTDTRTAKAVERLTQATDTLLARLEKPIRAYSVISGRDGSYEKTKEYEQLLENKSR